VGLVLDELDALGVANETLVVVHGDHGWDLGEHGMWGKQALWDPTTRVPLLIRAPWAAAAAGRRVRGFFEMVDLFDTVVELAGLPPPPDRNDGRSAAAAFRGPAAPALRTEAYSQYPRCKKAANDSSFDPRNPCTTGRMGQRTAFGWMGYSVRTAAWRYTVWLPWDGAAQQARWGAPAGRELYRHAEEPGVSFDTEQENLAADPAHNATAAALHAKLYAAWRSWAPRGHPGTRGGLEEDPNRKSIE
jgi:iduronate 2-sulfatase